MGLAFGRQQHYFSVMKLLTTVFAIFVSTSIGAARLGAATSICFAQEDARARFEAGVAAYDSKNYEEALKAFSEAYRIKPHPVVRLNLANCYERLGQPREAEMQYQKFLEEMPESPKVPEVKRSLARISKRIGTIHFDIEPANSNVTIDGEAIDPHAPHRVSAGRYTVSVAAPGYTSRSEEIAVPGGSEPHMRIHLERDMGASELSSEPSAENAESLEDGPDRGSEENEDEVAEQETVSDGGGDIPTATWIAGGAAVVLAAGAIAFGIMALSTNADFDDADARSNDLSLSAAARDSAVAEGEELADEANSLALAADLLWLGSAAAATTAVIFLLTADDDEAVEDHSFTAAPAIGPYGVGATIQGSF